MCAFVTNFEFDVFVSYAHVNNVCLVNDGMSPGWVSILIDNLKKLLSQKLGHSKWECWMDPRLKGNQSLTPAIRHAVTNSATLLMILSEGYLQSEWCREELELFCRAAQKHGGQSDRIFIVQLEEIDRTRWLNTTSDLISYEFFKKDSFSDRVRQLGYPTPAENDRNYYDKVLDLATDLGKCLHGLQVAPSNAINTPTPHTSAVFLAETTPDLEDMRDNIKRHLEQFNLTVLPKTYYNRSPVEFQAAMEEDLRSSAIFVQLLGPYFTRRTNDLPRGYEGLQLDIAKASGIPIMRWCDPGSDIKAANNSDLLTHDVKRMPFEDFKREVQNEVSLLVLSLRNQPPPDVCAAYALVNANNMDVSIAHEICNVLNVNYGIGFEIVDESIPLEKLIKSEKYCYDALVVVYGQCAQDWAQSQIRACREVMLRKKKRPMVCAVYVGPPPNKEPLRIKPPKFHFFDNFGDAKFKQFINAIMLLQPGVLNNE